MIISRVTKDELYHALERVVAEIESNVMFYDGTPEKLSKTGRRWRVRLAPIDTQLGGVLRGLYDGRRLKASCWHVYGWFFERLPSHTVIIYAKGRRIYRDSWYDWNVGSMIRLIMQSQRCDCMGGGVNFVPYNRPVSGFVLSDKLNKVRTNYLQRAFMLCYETVGLIPEELVPLKLPLDEVFEKDILDRFRLSRQRYDEGNVGY